MINKTDVKEELYRKGCVNPPPKTPKPNFIPPTQYKSKVPTPTTALDKLKEAMEQNKVFCCSFDRFMESHNEIYTFLIEKGLSFVVSVPEEGLEVFIYATGGSGYEW